MTPEQALDILTFAKYENIALRSDAHWVLKDALDELAKLKLIRTREQLKADVLEKYGTVSLFAKEAGISKSVAYNFINKKELSYHLTDYLTKLLNGENYENK